MATGYSLIDKLVNLYQSERATWLDANGNLRTAAEFLTPTHITYVKMCEELKAINLDASRRCIIHTWCNFRYNS